MNTCKLEGNYKGGWRVAGGRAGEKGEEGRRVRREGGGGRIRRRERRGGERWSEGIVDGRREVE